MANDNKIVMDIDLSPITARYAELYKDTKAFRKTIKELLQVELGVKNIPSALITKVQKDVEKQAKQLEKIDIDSQNRIRDNFIVNSNKIKNEMLNQQAFFFKARNSTVLFAKNADDLELKSYRTLQTYMVKEATNKTIEIKKAREKELADIQKAKDQELAIKKKADEQELKNFQKLQREKAKEEEYWKRNTGKSNSLYTPSGKYKTSTGAIDLNPSESLYTPSGRYKTSAGSINLASGLNSVKDAGKKAGEKYRDGFFDVFTNGTTFGHKLGTTLEYTLAGMGIYSGFQAITSFKDAIVEADKYLTMFQASLGLSKEQATGLQKSIFSMAKTYGLSTEELNKSSLALGRAGIQGKDLAEATKAVSQISKIAGEDLATVTDLFVSWNTVYPEVKMQHLADSMTAASVATKANMGDLKTVSNYLLTAGQQAGISSDGLLALSASMIQIGKSSSTAGTEGRRFFEQITRGSNDVKKVWKDLGINVDKLSAEMAKGGKSSTDAMATMFKILGQKSKQDLDEAFKNTKNVFGTLDAATIQTMYAISKAKVGFDEVLKKEQDGSVSAEEAANKAATSYESLVLKVKAGFSEIAVGFDETFRKQFQMSGKEAEEFNKNIQSIISRISSALNELAIILANTLKFVVKYKEEFEALFALFAASRAISFIGKLSGALAEGAGFAKAFSATIETLIGRVGVLGGVIAGVLSYNQSLNEKKQDKESNSLSKGMISDFNQTLVGKTRNDQIERLTLEMKQADNLRIAWARKYNSTINKFGYSESEANDLKSRSDAYKKYYEWLNKVLEAKKKEKEFNTYKKPNDNVDFSGDPKYKEKAKSANSLANIELQEKYKKIEEKFNREMLQLEIDRNAPLSEYEKHLLKVKELKEKISAAEFIGKKYGEEWLRKDLAYLTAKAELSKEEYLYKEKNNKLQEKINDAIKLSKYDEAIANARGEYAKINAELNKEIGLIDDKYDKEKEANEGNKKYLELLEKARDQEHKTAIDRTTKLIEETDKKFKKEADSIDLSNKKYREQFQLRTEYDSYFEDKQNEIEKTKIEMNATDVANIEKKARLQEHINYLQSISNNNLFLSLQIQKTIQDQLNSSLIDFFDISSKGWLNYKKLGMDVLNSIYKELLKQQIVAPLSKSGGELGGSLMKWVMGGFADGGYTGTGAKNDVKGVVHGGEYVIPQWMVNKSPSMINALESIRVRGYADGGVVSDTVKSLSPNSGNTKVEIINNTGQPIEATSAQTKFDGENYILSVVVDAVRRNKSGMRDILKGGR